MTEGCIQCFNVEERASTLNSICLKVINFNHKFGSIKMTLVAASGSLFSILDGIQLHPSFLSIFILTPSTKWNPSSSHEFFFCKPGVVGRLTGPVKSYAPTKAVGSTIYKFLLFHVFINIIIIMVAIFLLSKETTFSFNHHSPSPWSHSPACISQLAGAELGVLDATFWRPWSAVHAATWHLVGGGPGGVDGAGGD